MLVLKQARDGRMAKTKLIEVIVAREGTARRAETTAAVERVVEAHITKGKIRQKVENGVEYLVLP
jgi:hypothetical protein